MRREIRLAGKIDVGLQEMTATEIKDWLVPISSVVGIISIATTAWLALRDYGIKAKAEARLAEASRVEADIKLVNAFAELMDIAHARGPSQLANETLFEAMAKQVQIVSPEQAKDLAVITMPVGAASQDAAIVAIAVLGQHHSILKPMAVQALKSLSTFKPDMATPLLQKLETEQNP